MENTENLSASLNDAFDNAEITEEAPETVEDVTQEVAPEAEVIPEYVPLDAPEYFTKDHKDLFSKMQKDESSRGYAKAWYEQYTTGQEFINSKLAEVQANKQDMQTFNDYNQAMSPLANTWAANGMSTTQGLAQLSHYGQMLNSNPQQLIQEIANMGNIDLNKLIEEQPYVDPQVAQLQQQVQQLSQYNNSMNQQRQLSDNQTIVDSITEFQNATDDKGNSSNPYFEQVQNIMAELITIPNNDINDIKSAYDRAVQYNPEIQAQIQANTKKLEANNRQVEAIKATTASSKTTSNSNDAPVKNISWEEQMDIDMAASA